MKTQFFLFLVLALAGLNGLGQNPNNECGTDVMHNYLMQTDSAYRAQVISHEEQIQLILKNQVLQKTSGVVYTIPVVVHVIHTGEPIGTGTNLLDSQIQSTIDGMNTRFRNKNNSGGVDAEIEFCLAARDPNGNPTNGIVRVNGTSVTNYVTGGIDYFASCPGSANELSVKNLSRWPTTDYYNIWVVNKICGFTTGTGAYAYYPGAPSTVDGAVIIYVHFDSSAYEPAHELGHGFYLYHTFQDGCSTTKPGDYCADTPMTQGCAPCAGGTGIWDNSLYNYMSYCPVKNRFTQDQKNRMQAQLLIPPRASLLNSQGCISVAGLEENILSRKISIYPNPTCGKFTIKNEGVMIEGSEVEIYNVLGEKTFQSLIINYELSIDISNQPNGIYFLQVKSENRTVTQKLIIQNP